MNRSFRKRLSIKPQDLFVGQLVVVTESPEAQVYVIAEIEGSQARLTWFEGTRRSSCWHDKYDLMKPDLDQIQFTVSNYGLIAPNSYTN